jgi:hypothetical protein
MDYRQDARDRFDRIMRVPDGLMWIVGSISIGIGFLLPVATTLSLQERDKFLDWYIAAVIGIGLFTVLYVAVRSMAALIISAIAVRRARHHPTSMPAIALSIAASSPETRL